MKIIALEEHLLTKPVRDALTDPALAEPDVMSAKSNGTPLEARLEEVTADRIRRMDDSGVDVQVLSLTSPGVQTVVAAAAVDLARGANEVIAASVRANPTRFEGFATLPMADPAAAAVELDRAVGELGLKGAMVFPRVRGRSIDHADFLPVFETAARLRVPLYLHPQLPPQAVRDAYYSGFGDALDLQFATAGLGWHLDTGIQLLRLVLAGVFDRCPGLQVIVGHWGEGVLFYLERIDRLSTIAALERPVPDYFRHHVHVTPSGLFSQRYLAWTIDVLGAERVLFSVDDPYVEAPGGKARRFLEEAPIAQAQKEAIAHGNWERLLGRAAAGSGR